MAYLWATLFATAALFPTQSIASPAYLLQDSLNYTNFFDAFDFFTSNDPTNGYVNYVDRATATTRGYISADAVGKIRMSVDTQTVISPAGSRRGRDSIRISTKNDYTRGIIVGDIQHMPFGCGTWPAFWMLGPNWPSNGEIDIVEGVNLNTKNLNSLHASNGCTVSTQVQQATPETQDCYIFAAGQTTNAGCGSMSTSTLTYGSDFNANGGGVWAVQWTSQFIKIWFFVHGSEPADLLAENPDPDANAQAWGVPQSWFQGACVINNHFAIQNILFDNTFCGDWAGNDYVWGDMPANAQTGCAVETDYSTCEAYVAAEPGGFTEAYWVVNSVKYFREVPASPSTTSTTSTASSTSSSLTSSSTTSSSSFSSTSSTTSTTSTSATDYPCPNNNAQPFSSGSNTYTIACQTDLVGPDIASGSGATLLDCINLCNQYNTVNGIGSCTGVVHLIPNLYCYLKNAITGTQSGSTVDSALLVCSDCSSSVSSSSTTTGISTTTTSSPGTTTTSSSSSQSSSTSSVSSTFSSSSSSTSSILSSSMSSSSATSSPLSSSMQTSSSTSPSFTATTPTTATSTPTSTSYPCPYYNAQSFSSGNNNSYNVVCQTDLTGPNIASGRGANLLDCLDQCNTYNTLNGASACTGATHFQGYCYLKNGITGSTPNPNVDSALLICNGCPSVSVSTSSTAMATPTTATAPNTATMPTTATTHTTATTSSATVPTTGSPTTSSPNSGGTPTDAPRPGDPGYSSSSNSGSSLSSSSSASSNAPLSASGAPGSISGAPGLGFPFSSGQVIVHVVTTTTYCPWTCTPEGYPFPTSYPTGNTFGFQTYTETLGNIGAATGAPMATDVPGVAMEPPTGMGGSPEP